MGAQCNYGYQGTARNDTEEASGGFDVFEAHIIRPDDLYSTPKYEYKLVKVEILRRAPYLLE